MTEKSKALCRGCREDFYNEPGNSTSGECWLFKAATVVTRYRIGWWTRPTAPGAFTEVTTLNCHSEPGRFAFYKELPEFAMPSPSNRSPHDQ